MGVDAVDLRVALPRDAQLERPFEVAVDRAGKCSRPRRRRGRWRGGTARDGPPRGSRSRARVRSPRARAGRGGAGGAGGARGAGSRRGRRRRPRGRPARGGRARRRAAPGREARPRPASSFPPPSGRARRRRRNAPGTSASQGLSSPAGTWRRRPALIRCTRRTSSPSVVGKRRFLPRLRAPASERPSSALGGGSNVLSVATCPERASATGERATCGSSSRTHASTSGSSGMAPSVKPRSL